MPQQLITPIESALQEIERTFFAAREQWPRPGWEEEYRTSFLRLGELFEYVEMEVVRQDLHFDGEQQLHALREHCLWLVRRIGREVFFRTELAMERELRSKTATAAHKVYLRLIEIQDLEQEFLRLSDDQLAHRLLTGKLEQYQDLGIPLPE